VWPPLHERAEFDRQMEELRAWAKEQLRMKNLDDGDTSHPPSAVRIAVYARTGGPWRAYSTIRCRLR
jgi:hypothetical protein